MSTFCEVTRVVEVSPVRERSVQRYSNVFSLEARGQGFVVVTDFQLTFNFLVVEVEDCRRCFLCMQEVRQTHNQDLRVYSVWSVNSG